MMMRHHHAIPTAALLTRNTRMLVSRHRIGDHFPEVVHPVADPVAIAVCCQVLEDTGAECVVLHGSRGWGGCNWWSSSTAISEHCRN